MSLSIAVYLRISRSDTRSTSLAKQRENCLRYVEHTYPGATVKVYEDDGKSASKRTHARKAYLALVDALPTTDVVVLDTQDRISRKPLDFWTFAAKAEDAGTLIRGASEPLELESADGELTAGVRLAVARAEARRTAKRVLATNAYLASQGKRPLGGKVPFGLRREAGNVLRPVPAEAALILSAVHRVIAGELSIRGWAQELTETGVPTVAGAATWAHRTCSQLLRNPSLAGQVPIGKDVLRGPDGMPLVDPDQVIIDGPTWEALSSVLAERAEPTQRGPVGKAGERLPLLHGIVKDAEGHRLYAHRLSTRADRYACRMAVCAQRTTANIDPLDEYVRDAVLARIGHLAEVRVVTVSAGRDSERLASVRAQIGATGAALATERDPARIADLATRLTTLRATEAEIEASAVEERTEYRETGRTVAEAYAAAQSVDAQREIIAARVESVIVAKGKNGGRPMPLAERVEIVWRVDGGDDHDLAEELGDMDAAR
ncbi:recombinase family protein [Streptomyces sp. NPDC001982]|uniref:recombinase family protein n=1 Tax=Streptomyces sp. NPDC001982 TaxID=3154405 RepID=UPI003319E3CD